MIKLVGNNTSINKHHCKARWNTNEAEGRVDPLDILEANNMTGVIFVLSLSLSIVNFLYSVNLLLLYSFINAKHGLFY